MRLHLSTLFRSILTAAVNGQRWPSYILRQNQAYTLQVYLNCTDKNRSLHMLQTKKPIIKSKFNTVYL